MAFTKQDLITFALGAVITTVVILGEALVKLDGSPVVNWNQWGWGLLIGELTGLGRYIVTRAPELFARLKTLTGTA